MKFQALALALLFPVVGMAQVSVDNINAEQEGTTTIRIEKNRNDAPALAPRPTWEVQEGSADVEGETSATARDAKSAWKKACADWKKEFREDNKENKVLNVNCGSVSCGGEAGSKVCSSKATYKIKTRMD